MGTPLESYYKYLHDHGLRSTRQRDFIVEEFFKDHEHLTVEEILERVRQQDNTIGSATVYRTLNLLVELGLASKREFGGAKARYEHTTGRHHDHLICLGCNTIVEFENEQIEKLQEQVCKEHRFVLARHKMELYGYCQRCQIEKGKQHA